MQKLIFYDNYPSLYVFIGNFPLKLEAAIIKAVTKKENVNCEAKVCIKNGANYKLC